MAPSRSGRWQRSIAWLVATLNRIFGAFALILGVTFIGRVVAALVRGLGFRRLWLAAVLGVALVCVGLVYARGPSRPK